MRGMTPDEVPRHQDRDKAEDSRYDQPDVVELYFFPYGFFLD